MVKVSQMAKTIKEIPWAEGMTVQSAINIAEITLSAKAAVTLNGQEVKNLKTAVKDNSEIVVAEDTTHGR